MAHPLAGAQAIPESSAAMYDKSDPRSVLSAPAPSEAGVSLTPASITRYYRDDPVEDDANGRAWYTRGQNLLVNYVEAAPGAALARKGQPDEYMVVLPNEDTPWEITANGERMAGAGHQLVIVPPGDSEVRLPQGGLAWRLFSTQSENLNARCSNAATYAEPDASVPPFEPWPEPHGGYRLRAYDLWKTRPEGAFGPIWRCTTIMLNFPPKANRKRDPRRMSPHSHADFDQCSHHMRWPWGLDKFAWREDMHEHVGAPSCTIIPARVIHTSESQVIGNRMADIFAPPRVDFSVLAGWVQNADEYPLPKGVEMKAKAVAE
jgi:hypothetical protein